MKCKSCGLVEIYSTESEGLCAPCNDNQILERWHKPISSPSIQETLENAAEFDRQMTLPTDSADRKNYPLFRGCFRYFPSALAGVSRTSHLGNLKHNPGEELHHARGKSSDHGDCILRHLMDVQDLKAAYDRGEADKQQILDEVNQMVWRALAYSQELHESLGAPLAPGAKLPEDK